MRTVKNTSVIQDEIHLHSIDRTKANRLACPALFSLFSITIRNCMMERAVQSIVDHAGKRQQSSFAFVNADCLNKAWGNAHYRSSLDSMTEVYADGVGVKIAAKMHDIDVADNVNGTDLFPLLCAQAAEQNIKLFLLGAQEGVAETSAIKMQHRFPGLKIAGTQHGYFKQENTSELIDKINQSGADIVVIAFGAPLQEIWMQHYRQNIKAPVCIGVGGCLDFYAERISRAPKWLRAMSMEWVWRLLQEPKRMWRRYLLGNPLFLYRACKLAYLAGGDHVK